MLQDIHLTWYGPFSLFADQGVPCVFDDPRANETYGVYVWTIEHAGSHLVNYVGKTYGGNSNRTFAIRFAEELDVESGKDLCVDVDLFFTGIRKEVPAHRDRVYEVLRAYRLFIAPLPDLGDQAFLQIEGSLIKMLYDAGDKYGQFMAIPRCKRSYPSQISMGQADMLGLEALVSQSPQGESTTDIMETVSMQQNYDDDAKGLQAVRQFLGKPWNKHGTRRTTGEHKGWYEHDWGDLVQRISLIDYGHKQDIPIAAEIAKSLRKGRRTKAQWEQIETDPEAHCEILALVRSTLSTIEGPSTTHGD